MGMDDRIALAVEEILTTWQAETGRKAPMVQAKARRLLKDILEHVFRPTGKELEATKQRLHDAEAVLRRMRLEVRPDGDDGRDLHLQELGR